jgi:amidase
MSAVPVTSELPFLSAVELSRLVRKRQVGCVELLDLFIDRVERLDERINSVVVRNFEVARERAKRMDTLLSSPSFQPGPLVGVPMTVKESFDLAGQSTTWGLLAYCEHRAGTNALAVDRLIAAGANIFGKTNVPVLLADWQTFNPIYGTTLNPWDVARSPGGSSGGGAAAVAAGLSALEVGSDIGASIRNPAHYCGIYGHKPTWGICPPKGHAIPGHLAGADISVIGPLARSAEDLEVALKVIAGPDEIDAAGLRLSLAPPRTRHLRNLRVAVMSNNYAAEVDASVQQVVEAVADRLQREGATVDRDARPAIDPEEAHEAYILLLRAATSSRLDDVQIDGMLAKRQALSPDRRGYEAWLVRGATMLHRDWLRWNERRHRMRLAWAAFFKDWDVLICPAAASAAFPHNHDGERWERMIEVNGKLQPSTTQLFWAGYSGVALLPSTVAPVGANQEGLPIGVQIIGPQFGDLTTIAVAGALGARCRGYRPPPGFEA